MTIGIGIDIVEVERIEKLISTKENFLLRNFTNSEIEYFSQSKSIRAETVAGNFAAKEAFAKALGTGFRGFNLCDIEVLRNELGAPYINFRKERTKTQVSISHTKTTAVAVVIISE